MFTQEPVERYIQFLICVASAIRFGRPQKWTADQGVLDSGLSAETNSISVMFYIRLLSCQAKFARYTNDIQSPPIFSQSACNGLKQKLLSRSASARAGLWVKILAAPHGIATQHSCSIMSPHDSADVAEIQLSELPSRARNKTYPGNLPKKLARVQHADKPHDRPWAHSIPKFPKEEGSYHCTKV